MSAARNDWVHPTPGPILTFRSMTLRQAKLSVEIALPMLDMRGYEGLWHEDKAAGIWVLSVYNSKGRKVTQRWVTTQDRWDAMCEEAESA